MIIRLNEAVAYAKKNGNIIKKADLAKMLWVDSSHKTAHTNYSNLSHGRSKKIDIEFVPIICKTLGVSADFLFGLTNEPTKEGQIAEAIKKSPKIAVSDKIKEMMPQINELMDIINKL